MGKIRALFTMLHMIVTVTITIILMYIFNKNNRDIRIVWAKLQLKLMGIDLQIKGNYDSSADMLLINHQSIMDIVVLESIASRDVAWVAKKEIASIPWFGNILKVPKMIIVQRESKSSLIKLLKDSKDRLDNNRQIAIFPEGTRTDGTKIRKFKAGAKIIAQKYGLNIQPIVIIGSREVWDTKKFIQKSGVVKVVFLDTIKADKKTTWYEDTEEQMKNTLEENI